LISLGLNATISELVCSGNNDTLPKNRTKIEMLSDMKVEISAPARLHLGDLDPFALGRFGYAPILAIDEPRTIVEAEAANSLVLHGEEAEAAGTYGHRILEAFKLKGAEITIKKTSPRHSGFGSTTQLCLAIGVAVTRVYGLNPTLFELVRALKYTSTGGIYTFQKGGFVVSGGFRVKPDEKIFLRDEPLMPPLIFRSDFPDSWKFVIVRPKEAPKSPDAEVEEQAFKELQRHKAPSDLTHRAYFLLASKLLPALIEKDAVAFGAALTEIQVVVGRTYLPVQGSIFNPASQWLIPIIEESGAIGIGQSSWGPTLYGFTDSVQAAERIRKNIDEEAKGKAFVSTVGADNNGARIRIMSS
jgi:beta-ribofuranosylaminobenzene 5'-phosphate synthase